MLIYLFDLLMVALVVFCVWLGWKRGFVRTVSGLMALIVAALVAAVFSGPVSKAVYADMVKPRVVAALEQHIEGEHLPSAETLDAALQSLPSVVTTVLDYEGLGSGAAILRKVGETGEPAVATITRKVITPVMLPLMRTLCSVVLFILTYLLALLAARALNVVAKLPLIKQTNQLLGLLAGAVTGALWMVFAIRLLYAVAAFGVFPWLTPDRLGNTLLISYVVSILP